MIKISMEYLLLFHSHVDFLSFHMLCKFLLKISFLKRIHHIIVNLRERATRTPPLSANKTAHSDFEPRGDVTRSPKLP